MITGRCWEQAISANTVKGKGKQLFGKEVGMLNAVVSSDNQKYSKADRPMRSKW